MVRPNDISRKISYNSKEIFIVHGYDNTSKYELARRVRLKG
jgi:hypothetical protein